MVSGRVFMGIVLSGLVMLPGGSAVSSTLSGKVTSVNVSSLPAFSCEDKSSLPNDLTADEVMGKTVIWLAKKKLFQVTTDHGPVCVRRSTIETDIPVAVPEKGHCVTMGTSDSTSASSNGLSGACN